MINLSLLIALFFVGLIHDNQIIDSFFFFKYIYNLLIKLKYLDPSYIINYII